MAHGDGRTATAAVGSALEMQYLKLTDNVNSLLDRVYYITIKDVVLCRIGPELCRYLAQL